MDGSDLMTPILELKNIDYSYHTLDGETKALSNIGSLRPLSDLLDAANRLCSP